jgi:hypothetical protein
MADAEGNLALHCYLSWVSDSDDVLHEVSEEADCLRFLLKHYPEAAAIDNSAGLSPYRQCVAQQTPSFVRRLMLLACPSLRPDQLKLLNYQARRQAMFLFFAAVPARRSCRGAKKSPSSLLSTWWLLRLHGDMNLIRNIVCYL